MSSKKAERASTLRAVREQMAARPTAVELFSGVGGLSLGLEMAGFSVPVAVEIEDVTGRYAQYNFPASHVLYGHEHGDVRQFGRERLHAVAPELVGDVALVAGGPPCQGFSLAGKKNAADPLNTLVLEFARVVLELRPLALLMENVPGITVGSSTHLADAMRQLDKHYRLCEPGSLVACDFGVPQARERVFLVGIRRDLGIEPSLPTATHLRPHGSQLTLGGEPIAPTVGQAISDLPAVDEYPELIDSDRVPYDKEPRSAYERMMRGVERNECDLALVPAWDTTICTNVRRTQHGPELLSRFAQLDFGRMDKTSGIRRLDPDDVSTTIRAGTTKERGSWSAPRPLHPYQHRVLTTRECARLQSFPDWFVFHPVKWHGNRQVGNAVPPLLGRAVGAHILTLLGLSPRREDMPAIERDSTLVCDDIERAAESGLSRRRISQKVIHPSKSATQTPANGQA